MTVTSGKIEDDVDGYGADLKKSLDVFGRSMHESVELADELEAHDGELEPDDLEPDEDDASTTDTQPRSTPMAPGEEADETEAMIREDTTAAMVVEQERTTRMSAKGSPDSGHTPIYAAPVARNRGASGTMRVGPTGPVYVPEPIPSSRVPPPPSSGYGVGRPSLPGDDLRAPPNNQFDEIRRYFVANPWAAVALVLVPVVAVLLIVALMRSEPKPADEQPAPARAIH